jgi:hypothetical protein
MSDLLPCPFCGGEAGKIVDATRILGTFNLIHRCPIIGTLKIERATREGVIAKWNTRAPSQAQISAAVKVERERCAKATAVKLERERCAKLAAARADYIEDAVLRGGSEGFIQSLRFARAELSDIAATIRKGDQP